MNAGANARTRAAAGSATVAFVFVTAAALIGCDDDPVGVPYRAADLRIAGSYRSAELVAVGGPAEMGEGAGELRLSLGTSGRFAGRLFLPEEGPDGSDLQARLRGHWNSQDKRVAVSFGPTIDGLPGHVDLVAEFFADRVELTGTLSVNGRAIGLLLTKPVNDGGAGGGGPRPL